MGRLLTTRRAEWLPGVALLFAAVGIGALLGLTADARSWPLYVGVIGVVLAVVLVSELFLQKRHAPPPSHTRESFRVIRGGRAGHNPTRETTETQRWLM
jgi:hypothetical protein